MMLPQSKGNNSFLRRGVKSCFYCGKPSYIAHFCYKANNKEHEKSEEYEGQ